MSSLLPNHFSSDRPRVSANTCILWQMLRGNFSLIVSFCLGVDICIYVERTVIPQIQENRKTRSQQSADLTQPFVPVNFRFIRHRRILASRVHEICFVNTPWKKIFQALCHLRISHTVMVKACVFKLSIRHQRVRKRALAPPLAAAIEDDQMKNGRRSAERWAGWAQRCLAATRRP